MKQGDIYRWRYKDVEAHGGLGDFRAYHCKSRIAVVNSRGQLVDTFWGNNPTDGSYVNRKIVHLEKVGNFDGLQKIPEYEQGYYAKKDVVNLNHPNSSNGNLYIRKEAKRSKAKMLELMRQRISEKQREIESANHSIKIDLENIERIKSDDLDGYY